MKKLIIILCLTGGYLQSEAQSVGIGTTTPHISAILDLTSTTKGFLLPHMTGAQRTAIASPATGLQVYQTNSEIIPFSSPGLYIYNGSSWKRMARAEEITAGTSSWTVSGDNQYSNVDGNVGIGVTSGISEKLFLNGDMLINAPGGGLGSHLNSAELKLRGTNVGSGVIKFLNPDSTDAAAIYYSSFYGSLAMKHADHARNMRIHSNGNVGIGTGAWPDTAVTTLHVRQGDFADLTTHHGYLMTGSRGSENIVIGNYEILARNDGAASPLYLQHEGGAVRIGNTGTTADTRLHITNGGESSLTTHGYMVLGPTTGGNLVMDPNEIQARSNGAATTLRLQQDGGPLMVQGGALIVASNGNVGIGDLTPDEQLHVAGNGLFNALNPTIQLQNEGIDKGFVQLSGNNIRIGTNSSNLAGHFVIRTGGGDRVFVNQNGHMGIGTGPVTEHRLAVLGSVICEELKVELVADWPDYVFSENYSLTPLSELKTFIETHRHLPNIPKASDVMRDGIEVGEMHRKLLEKVEELTLYLIQKDEQIEAMENEINSLKIKYEATNGEN